MEKRAFEAEGDRLVGLANANQITLRLLGALAFAKRCPKHAHLQETLNRVYTDIDFAAYGRQVKEIRSLFDREGFVEDELTYVESEGSRMVLNHAETGLHLDVFLDKLEFCHTIRWAGRLETDDATIPLAEMLLQKMQIVQINEKDIIDTIMLLLEHPIAEDDSGINLGLVARICAKDWGWWRTLTMNLRKVEQMAGTYRALGEEEVRRIADRVVAALDRIDREPKSIGWRMRARVGDRKKWYRDVGELADRVQEL